MADTTTAVYALTKPGNLDAAGAGVWGPKLNGDFDSIDTELSKPRIIFNSPTIGATTTLDCALGRVFALTVTQITTLAFANVPSASFAVRVRLLLTNGAAFAVTFPASVTWLSGTVPIFKTAGVDEIEFLSKDGGVTWFASLRADPRSQVGTSSLVSRPSRLLMATNGGTGATGESSLCQVSIPANALALTNDSLRIKLHGNAVTQAMQLRVKFGASYILNIAGGNNVAVGEVYEAECVIRRTGAASQVAVGRLLHGATLATLERSLPAETLSGTVLLDIRGNTASAGGIVNVDLATVDYLSV